MTFVRLRGLPWEANEQQIRDFFHDLSVAEVVICQQGGRATGEGFVRFRNEADIQRATSKHKQSMGRRFVEVFVDTRNWDSVFQSSSHGAEQHVVKLKGLPFRCTRLEICEFLGSDVGASEHDIHIVLSSSDGRPTGVGFVTLASQSALSAVLALHRKHFGRQYIEVFPSTTEEMQAALQTTPTTSATTAPQTATTASGQVVIVSLRGIPFSASEADVAGFCSGFPVVSGTIEICKTSDGRSAGTANVGFASMRDAEDFVRARHRKNMGQRFVELRILETRTLSTNAPKPVPAPEGTEE